jgi:hypothetical protein
MITFDGELLKIKEILIKEKRLEIALPISSKY